MKNYSYIQGIEIHDFDRHGEKLIFSGRLFLKSLIHAEQAIKDNQTPTLPETDLALAHLRNWIRVIALMIRKLDSYFLDAIDFDPEIFNPIFYLLQNEGVSNEVN